MTALCWRNVRLLHKLRRMSGIFAVYSILPVMPAFCASVFNLPIFSTKTPYEWLPHLQHKQQQHEQYYVDDSTDVLNGCQPVHLNFVIRHGARHPGAKDVKKFSKLWSKVHKDIESSEYQEIKNWQNRFIGVDKEIAELGRMEQFNLGVRIGHRFRNILKKSDSDGLRVIVSSKSRTKDSAVSFYEGLSAELEFEKQDGLIISLSDETLRFFDNCEKYLSNVDNNEEALREHKKFLSSQLLKELARKVTDRLQLKTETLTPGEVRVIYYLCALETAFYNSSVWCGLIREDELPVLEYLMDLKHYWKKAYGYEINYIQSCPLTEAIFTAIREAVTQYSNDQKHVSGVFQFGHAETVLPLYAILGLYRDDLPLLADNYDLHQYRTFRSSLICPFSANIGFVVYDCKNKLDKPEGDGGKFDRFAIRVLVNEKPVVIPGCDSELCPLSQFQNLYKHISRCDFSSVCMDDDTDTFKDEL